MFMSQLIQFHPAKLISVKRYSNDELQQIFDDDVKGLLHLNSASSERISHYRGSKKQCVSLAPIRETTEDWDRDITASLSAPRCIALPPAPSVAHLECGTILFNDQLAYLDVDDILSEEEADLTAESATYHSAMDILVSERSDIARKLKLVSNVLAKFTPDSKSARPFKNSQLSLSTRLEELDLHINMAYRPLKRVISSASMP